MHIISILGKATGIDRILNVFFSAIVKQMIRSIESSILMSLALGNIIKEILRKKNSIPHFHK